MFGRLDKSAKQVWKIFNVFNVIINLKLETFSKKFFNSLVISFLKKIPIQNYPENIEFNQIKNWKLAKLHLFIQKTIINFYNLKEINFIEKQNR